MSIFTMAFTGTMPLGNLLAGWIAGREGPSTTLIISSVICVSVGIVFYMRLPRLRADAAPVLARVAPIEATPQ